MKIKNLFNIPYGYRETNAFDSKQSKIEEALNDNSSVDRGQDDKIDSEIKRSTEEDEKIGGHIDSLVNKDKDIDKAVSNLINKDKALDQAVSNLIHTDQCLRKDLEDLKTQIPSIDGSATQEWVNEQGFLKEVPAEYVTEEELAAKGFLTEHQDISRKLDASVYESEKINFVSKSWVEEQKFLKEHQDISGKLDKATYDAEKSAFALKSELPDVSDMETQTHAFETYQKKGDYALKTELPSIEGLAKESAVNEALALKADKAELPSIEGLAKESVVNEALALKADKAEIAGMATQTWVNEQGFLKEVPAEVVTEEELAAKGFLTEHQDVSTKAEKAEVEAALALKTDLSEHIRVKNLVQENLTYKANKEDVEAALALKADKAELPSIEGLAKESVVNEALALKAEKAEVEAALALKADQENLNALNTLVGKVSNTLKEQIETKADDAKVTELSTKMGSIKVEKINPLQYNLMLGEEVKGTIDIPKDQFLKSVSFVDETNSLKFIFSSLEDENKEIVVDINKLVDVYTNGDGIKLEGNVFSVMADPTSEKYLSVTSEGIAVKGIDEALALKTDLSEHIRVKNLVQENLKIKANKEDVEKSLALKADKTELPSIEGLAKESVVNEALALKADKEEVKDVVKTTAIPSEDMPNRKAIVLENHDALMGKSSTGKVNIAMVSKWDVADFGSRAVHCNLNGKSERPTYNDDKPIALVSDVDSKVDAAWVNQQGFLKEIPAEYVTEEELAAKGFLTEHQNISTKAEKADVAAALELKADKTELPSIEGLAKESVVNEALNLKANQADVDEALKLKLDVAEHIRVKDLVQENLKIKANKEDVAASLALKADKEEVKDAVKTTAIPSEDMPNRKAIVMENHDALMGKSSAGLTNIAMISKFDVADFGSKAVHCNLNGKYPRPTYNDDKPIAIAEDIFNTQDAAKAQFDVLMAKISQLEDKLAKADEKGAKQIASTGEDIVEDNANLNYVVSGEFANKVSVKGKDVIVKDVVTSAGLDHRFASDKGEITIKNCKYSGEHPKSVSNVEVGIQSNDIVNIRDCQFDTNTYNQIEISLNGAYTAKGINVDNCHFGGKKTNNAMSIFGLKDNAVINITNCVFDDVSNPLRISNHSNAKNVTINIIDCKVNKWEANLEQHGFICFQDYTSKSAEAELANKQFSTMVVNFVNLVGPDGKILPNATQEEVCGSKDEKQLIYVYYNKGGLMPYSKDNFPTVNVR